MGLYLNKKNDYFIKVLKSKIYVDKSMLIKEANELIGTNDGFMCITRPRRFGKRQPFPCLTPTILKAAIQENFLPI